MQGEMYCWIVFLDRDPSQEEFNIASGLLDSTTKEKLRKMKGDGEPQDELFRIMISRILPMWMLRNRGVLRGSWILSETREGKPYVASPVLSPQLAFDVAYSNHAAGIVFSEVANTVPERIGIDIMQLMPTPPEPNIQPWIQSCAHMVTPLERSMIHNQPEQVAFRRMTVIWTIKYAYIKALGIRPEKFNFLTMECDVPRGAVRVDNAPLLGWEFRLFKASVGSAARGEMKPEEYQVACALYHGPTGLPTRVSFGEEYLKMDQWIKFINLDGVMQFVREMYKEDPAERKARARAAAMPDVHGPGAQTNAARFVQSQAGHTAAHR
ncbi:hypothetical protein DACRYDRAFT_23010 [Dacryopinax primogenitus]|uniref:holo-[acyl-carrier-protein] synthase n=1 Tax=Dacryopinax primogenitus (strain DJM 731) TaxID=1858805 RepID=M5FW14_DACPD|nr:uncharacterized protein DACRYDRAFT_23010 [Dacryopinax primogenitus]EJU00554.1 hypothetical protein DACRYDRAFT_23010 [Dacryopinax primogenitus]